MLAAERQNPDAFETERVGRPKMPNQSLGVDVLEWYDPSVSYLQDKNRRRAGHPPL